MIFNPEAKTTAEQLRRADWGQLERETIARLRLLRDIVCVDSGDAELDDDVANRAIQRLALLEEFLRSVPMPGPALGPSFTQLMSAIAQALDEDEEDSDDE